MWLMEQDNAYYLLNSQDFASKLSPSFLLIKLILVKQISLRRAVRRAEGAKWSTSFLLVYLVVLKSLHLHSGKLIPPFNILSMLY